MELNDNCQERIKEAIQLLLSDSYYDRYFLLCAERGNLSTKEVWELLEDQIFALTGRNRFGDYQTFQRQRWRYVKSLGQKK